MVYSCRTVDDFGVCWNVCYLGVSVSVFEHLRNTDSPWIVSSVRSTGADNTGMPWTTFNPSPTFAHLFELSQPVSLQPCHFFFPLFIPRRSFLSSHALTHPLPRQASPLSSSLCQREQLRRRPGPCSWDNERTLETKSIDDADRSSSFNPRRAYWILLVYHLNFLSFSR